MWRLDELGKREFHAQSDESLISGPISLTSITTRSPQAGPFALYRHQDMRNDPAASGLRYKVSQLAYVEDPGPSAQLANPSHAHHYSENLMQGTGTWQVDAEGFETLDEGDEGDDSDLMLFLDDPDGADVTVFEEPLV